MPSYRSLLFLWVLARHSSPKYILSTTVAELPQTCFVSQGLLFQFSMLFLEMSATSGVIPPKVVKFSLSLLAWLGRWGGFGIIPGFSEAAFSTVRRGLAPSQPLLPGSHPSLAGRRMTCLKGATFLGR